MSTLCSKCGLVCGEAEYVVHLANNCHTVKCPQCPQFYENEDALIKHTRAIHNKEYQCTICQVELATKYTLERHMLNMHKQAETETATCEKCGETFEGKYFLRKHMLNAHKKAFVCSLCSQEFVTIHTLKRHWSVRHKNGHLSSIQRAKEFRIDCPICGKLIAKSALQRHLRVKHKDNKILVCYVCDKECPTEKALQKHLDSRHPEEHCIEALLKKKFKCPQCPCRFASKWTLQTHIRGKHEQEFVCELCDKYFSAPIPLSNHKAKVHGIKIENANEKPEKDLDNSNKKYHCPQCPRRFIDKWALKTHIRGKHDKEFKCELCDKFFSSPFSLYQHNAKIHGIKTEKDTQREMPEEDCPNKKHKCPHCPQRFTEDWTLKLHIRGKHEQEFKCELCEKCFSSPHSLLRHKSNVHGITNENSTSDKQQEKAEEGKSKKRYKCPQCSRSFAASWVLRNHIKGKHEQAYNCEICNKPFSAPFPLMRHKMSIHGIEIGQKISEETLEGSDNEEKCRKEDGKSSTLLKVKVEDDENSNE